MTEHASGGESAPWGCGWLPRDGFALAIALLATLLIAALLTALFVAVNEETRTELAVTSRDRALAVAESALEAALRNLDAERPPASPLGTAESRSVDVNGHSAVVHMTRLDSSLFWLVAVASNDGAQGSPARRIGALAAVSNVSGDSISVVRVTRRGWSELF